MDARRPLIKAEIVFLTAEEGGRAQAPAIGGGSRYMPHIVIQDRAVRRAESDASHVTRDAYQGVYFKEAPPDFRLGVSGSFVVELMQYPKRAYEDVQPGATFTVREGPRVVAHGIVLSREDSATKGRSPQ
jgi:hypothetical protein